MASGLEICLECWEQYMGHHDRDAGYSAMKFLTGENDSFGDPEALDMRRDNEIAIATDKSIDCLNREEAWAIKKARGLTKTWPYASKDYLQTLDEGLRNLESMLRKHIATWSLF